MLHKHGSISLPNSNQNSTFNLKVNNNNPGVQTADRRERSVAIKEEISEESFEESQSISSGSSGDKRISALMATLKIPIGDSFRLSKEPPSKYLKPVLDPEA